MNSGSLFLVRIQFSLIVNTKILIKFTFFVFKSQYGVMSLKRKKILIKLSNWFLLTGFKGERLLWSKVKICWIKNKVALKCLTSLQTKAVFLTSVIIKYLKNKQSFENTCLIGSCLRFYGQVVFHSWPGMKTC